ncbi:MAG: magnesium transporter [Ruminococcaceae bacterium]|nr:magnesium transporter [Oscillospiraceae bacterium]
MEVKFMQDKILELLKEKKYLEVKKILSQEKTVDIAEILNDVSDEFLPICFRILPKDTAADVFSYMDSDSQEKLIKTFSDSELKEIINDLYVDDAAALIEEMPSNVVKRILRSADPEMRKSINMLLQYPKNSAGSIMTTEYVSLKRDMTVSDAFDKIRKYGVDSETIYTAYITSKNRRLIGTVSAKTLLLSDMNSKIEDIMDSNFVSVATTEDKEAVADLFMKYDLLALPVVDAENRFVGIVTVDDAIDVVQDEATEDIEAMAAIVPTDKTYIKTGVFETFLKRIPWLLILMVSATFAGSIIRNYENALQNGYVILTAFIPMLMGTGGNCGSQASTSVIRAISLGEITIKNIFSVIWKEIRVAFLCGVTLAIANFAKLMLVDRVSFEVSLVVCLTLVITVFLAKFIGCVLPILAKAIKLDPAVMASPFITTILDAISLIAYFNIATAVLGI